MALIQINGLSKNYAGVAALKGVSLSLEAGEVHALVGENGAGKSTLIKCLSGVVRPDEGRIVCNGRPLLTGGVHMSQRAGIAVIHQESTAFGDLDAVDNLFVGRELTKRFSGQLDRRRMENETRRLLDRLGQTFPLRTPLRHLSVAQRQMVALARALSQDCRLLILDEPTASLSVRETDALTAIVRSLRSEGVGILYVSHRLDEVFALADRVTVLRDGRLVATHPTDELSRQTLISLMVGREVSDTRPRSAGLPQAVTGRQPRLSVRGLTRHGAFHEISFDLHAGEIVGLAGLVGAGRSEVARAVFGIDSYDAGTVQVEDRCLPRADVSAAIRAGVALVPEDRQHEGLLLPMSVRENLSLAALGGLSNAGFVDRRREQILTDEMTARLDVRTADSELAARNLSGGNQQKVVIGKWLSVEPRVLLLDEPTRGVDVGAKSQVHQVIQQLAQTGLATLVISSEMEELVALCDRLLVMREGRLSGELAASEATREKVLQLALPV